MDFSPSTILVIADHLTSRSRLCQILNQAGYSNVLGADSEQQALATLSSFLENQENKEGTGAGVDLIIVDLGDPEMAGVATFRKLKGASQTAEIPVIMVTAASKGAPLVDALAQEDMDYVTRPVEQLELLSRVKKALQLKKEIEQRKELAQKLAEANKRVQGAALIDPLTGLANRRAFDDFLELEWRRCRRQQQNITLCQVDIDFFKSYNKNYGHSQGDACLKKVAAILLTIVKRPGDLVARYSGKEFALLLSATTDSGGCAVATRVMEAVAARNIPHAHSPISDRITLSCGVAMLVPKAATAVHDLLTQANHALYQAKKMGHNRIICPALKEHPLR
ncbi:MAG: diguanylate cyclase [Deltaproteobacteria bacterium]|nr:diguanylate cyclase [Deltaproteobacteria bacterium]